MVDPTALSAFVHGEDTVCESPWTVQTPADGFPSSGIADRTHSRMNKTILPDEFLAEGRHIFLIRHPAITIPSYYRAFVDIHGQDAVQTEEASLVANVTLHWTRCTYDWLKSTHPSSDGVVILDGDDIITNPLPCVTHFTGSKVVGHIHEANKNSNKQVIHAFSSLIYPMIWHLVGFQQRTLADIFISRETRRT